jgi:hypothetical protein
LTTLSTIFETATFVPTAGRVQPFVEPVDEALRTHQSARYWDWLRLYEADAIACPFQHPDVALIDIQYGPVTPQPPVVIGLDRDGECHGLAVLAPKTVSTGRIGGFGPSRRLQGLRLIGNGCLQQHADPLVTAELLRVAFAHVAESQAGFLLIEDLDEASPAFKVLKQCLPAGWMTFRHAGVQPRRRIQLPDSCDQYWSKFSGKTRSTFRRKLKKFGQTRLDRITEIEQIPAFLEAAHAISRETWQTRQFGLRVRHDDHTLEQFATLARLRMLRCYLWHVNDEPVAFTIGNQDHGCFHYEEVGYRPEHARFSPGQMMLIQMIDDLIQHDRPEWFDFGGGDADYKQLFATHESASGTVWLFPPTAANQLTVTYLRGCHALRHTARKWIGNAGLTSRFRQWVRSGGRMKGEEINHEVEKDSKEEKE